MAADEDAAAGGVVEVTAAALETTTGVVLIYVDEGATTTNELVAVIKVSAEEAVAFCLFASSTLAIETSFVARGGFSLWIAARARRSPSYS